MFACPDVRFSASHVLCGIVYRGIFTRHAFWRAYPATSSMTTGGCKAAILILSSIGYKSIISRLTAEFFFHKTIFCSTSFFFTGIAGATGK
jgi:hypothetical protein